MGAGRTAGKAWTAPTRRVEGLALEPSPERRDADLRWSLHQDEARPLQVLHEPLGDDLGHDLVGIVDALAALKAQGEGDEAGP